MRWSKGPKRSPRRSLDTYPEPDITFADLRKMAKGHALDLLYEFGKACRRESEARMKG
jgi:hypothetical protein